MTWAVAVHEHHSVSNHLQFNFLFESMLMFTTTKTPKPVLAICEGNPSTTVESPHKRAVMQKCFHAITSCLQRYAPAIPRWSRRRRYQWHCWPWRWPCRGSGRGPQVPVVSPWCSGPVCSSWGQGGPAPEGLDGGQSQSEHSLLETSTAKHDRWHFTTRSINMMPIKCMFRYDLTNSIRKIPLYFVKF